MSRKKGIILTAIVETVALAILVALFLKGFISFNLYLVLCVLVCILFSIAVLFIIKNTKT